MATAQILPSLTTPDFDLSSHADRAAIVDSVLGTMGAEGELPSEKTQRLMQSFTAGQITIDEMSEAILEHAHRMVHEANSRRLAVR